MEKEIDMTAAQIVKTISALLLTGHVADFREACALFNGIDDEETFDRVYARLPGMINYDAKGNYVGNYHKENGWTA